MRKSIAFLVAAALTVTLTAGMVLAGEQNASQQNPCWVERGGYRMFNRGTDSTMVTTHMGAMGQNTVIIHLGWEDECPNPRFAVGGKGSTVRVRSLLLDGIPHVIAEIPDQETFLIRVDGNLP